MGNLPLFKAWSLPDYAWHEGWCLGFWLAPFPIEEQITGAHVRCLVLCELSLKKRWPFVKMFIRSDDRAKIIGEG